MTNNQIRWLVLEEAHVMEDYYFLRVVATGLKDPAAWVMENERMDAMRFEIDRGKYKVGDLYDD